jgi:hypothetical protein
VAARTGGSESRVTVRMFGGFELDIAGVPIAGRDLGGTKPKQLLELLLLERGRMVAKDLSRPGTCRSPWTR